MRKRLPPLSTLRAFETVARLGSVTLAAAELGRTHGAVSRQLRALHETAGIAFFAKHGTGLRLNRQGEALRAVVGETFERLEQGWQRILDEASGRSLHVACSATFAMRWLVPRLAGFYQAHPEVALRLSMTSARDIRDQGADLVIAWDRSTFPARDAEVAIPLSGVSFGPVCHRDYPVALDGDALGFETRIDHAFTARAWTGWQETTGYSTRHRAERHFPHTHLCVEAALAGLGVALVEERMVHVDVAAGRLRAPCGFAALPEQLAVVPIGERGRTETAGAFVAWLRATLAEDRP